MRISREIVFVLAVSGFVCLQPVRGQSLAPVIMPSTDIMAQVRFDKIQASPIFMAWKELQKEQASALPPAVVTALEEMDLMTAEICQMTGMESSDILSLVATADLDGLDLENLDDIDAVEALAGFSLAKALSMERLREGVLAFFAKKAEEERSPLATVNSMSYKGTAVLKVQESEDETPYCLSLIGGNKVLVIGSPKAVEGALDRSASEQYVSPKALFSAPIGEAIAGRTCYVMVRPTAALRAKMTAAAKEDVTGSPAKAWMALMAQVETTAIGIDFGRDLDVSLSHAFTSAEVAQKASMMMDAQIVSGIKMFAFMMTGGVPLPILNTMKTGTGADNVAWLKMTLSKADLDVFGQVLKQKQQAELPAPETVE